METKHISIDADLTFCDVLEILDEFKPDCKNLNNVITTLKKLKNRCDCNECIFRLLTDKNTMILTLK